MGWDQVMVISLPFDPLSPECRQFQVPIRRRLSERCGQHEAFIGELI